jgi:protein TonB
MGNAEKALALSLLAHALLAAGVVALLGTPSSDNTGVALDVTSVELSLADDDSASVASSSPASKVKNAAQSVVPPADESLSLKEVVKTPESVLMPGTVEIPLAQEPAVEMRFEKPAAEAAVHTSGSDQARVEAPASPLRSITPKYPRASRLRGEEGLVRLELTVDALGVVTKVSVAVSSGFKAIDAAAVKAVKSALFNPAVRDGAAVESTAALTFVFKLK